MYWIRSRQQFLISALIRLRCWVLPSLFIILFLSLFQRTSVTHAFPVPELPGGNLIVNPWFRDATDLSEPGFDGWTRIMTNGVTWGPSQKISNPAPDIVISADCGYEQVFCGTAARWAAQGGVTYPNIDVILYQVVAANPAHRQLRFFTHWVSHRVEAAYVEIYGSHSPNGPWTLVWEPFFHSQDEVIIPPSGDVADLWEVTGFLEKTLVQGFNYYKVQFRARLPEGDGVGFKTTGVYFTTKGEDGNESPLSYVYLPFLGRFR